MDGHANFPPSSSPPTALYLPRSQAQISQTGKAPATPIVAPKPKPTTTASGKRKAIEPMATAATKRQKVAPPPLADANAEKNRLFAFLFRDYGTTLTRGQISHDVNLMYWYRWDHRRYVPYFGSREEGNCPAAKIIIPGHFPALPHERAVPILPTPETIKNQIDEEERENERVENEKRQRAVIERQRAEMATPRNPQGYTSQTWYNSPAETQVSSPPHRNADQGLFIAQEYQPPVPSFHRTDTHASVQRREQAPRASHSPQESQAPWSPQNLMYTPQPSAISRTDAQASSQRQGNTYQHSSQAAQAPWVPQNLMYTPQPSEIPRPILRAPYIPQANRNTAKTLSTPQPSSNIPRPISQASSIPQGNRNTAKALSPSQSAQLAPIPQKYTYSPQGYAAQASFVPHLVRESILQTSSTTPRTPNIPSQPSPSTAHKSTNNTPSPTSSKVSQPTTLIASTAPHFQPAVRLTTKQRGKAIADKTEAKIGTMFNCTKIIRDYLSREQCDGQEAEIMESIQECHQDIKWIKDCSHALEYHLRSLGVWKGILKHMSKMSTSLAYVESNFKDKGLEKEVVVALDEVDAELTWMKTSLNSVYQWCQCSACMRYYR